MKKIALLTASAAAALVAIARGREGRIFGAENIRRHIQQQPRFYARGASNSIAKLNRHTKMPHEHKREIARRRRQAEARAAR